MNWIKRGVAAVRWTYDFILSRIEMHPAVTFWLVVAYLVLRR